jgi:hypothetical protein
MIVQPGFVPQESQESLVLDPRSAFIILKVACIIHTVIKLISLYCTKSKLLVPTLKDVVFQTSSALWTIDIMSGRLQPHPNHSQHFLTRRRNGTFRESTALQPFLIWTEPLVKILMLHSFLIGKGSVRPRDVPCRFELG